MAAVRVLDDIVCRMQAHQSKKSAGIRQLHSSAVVERAIFAQLMPRAVVD